VSLNGIRIEVGCSQEPALLTQRLHEFARDLGEQHFPDWGVRVTPAGELGLSLAGGRDGTRFEADVNPEPGRVVVVLRGHIELAWVKVTLAGGPEGVRRRVTDEVRKALASHLE
jgi:hypothetical protein